MRSHGMSSGRVPSRTPSARPTRVRALLVRSDRSSSFSAAWISDALHPGNAPLSAAVRKRPPSNRQIVSPRTRPRRAARRLHLRDLHPDFRETQRLVERKLPPANVRGVVDLEDHVRKIVLTHRQRGVERHPRPIRVQVHRLVRLQKTQALAAFVAFEEARVPEARNLRAAHPGDDCAKPREAVARPLVGAAHVAELPRRLRRCVPVLDVPVVCLDFVAPQPERPAAGELGGVGRSTFRARRWRGRVPRVDSTASFDTLGWSSIARASFVRIPDGAPQTPIERKIVPPVRPSVNGRTSLPQDHFTLSGVGAKMGSEWVFPFLTRPACATAPENPL